MNWLHETQVNNPTIPLSYERYFKVPWNSVYTKSKTCGTIWRMKIQSTNSQFAVQVCFLCKTLLMHSKFFQTLKLWDYFCSLKLYLTGVTGQSVTASMFLTQLLIACTPKGFAHFWLQNARIMLLRVFRYCALHWEALGWIKFSALFT